ncbi:MAG TPA: YCF48-related protein [Terriglobales bacterium]|jgi:hypothetical protein
MKPLPKIVQWQFQKALSVSGLPHPDADQLTAFVELSLPRAERTAVLEHLSLCSECRQVAAFAEAPVTLPAVKLRNTRSWRPVLAWSMVAACLLIVAAFVLSSRNQRKELAEAMLQQLPATQKSSRSASPKDNLEATSAKQPTAGTVANSNAKKTAGTIRHQVIASNMPQSSPEAPQSRATDAMDDAPDKDKSAHPASSEIMAGAISTTPQTAPQADDARAKSANDMRESFAPSVPNTSAPNSNIDDRYPRWTLNSDGNLLRSLDTGASWQKISIPGNTALLHSIATVGAEVWVGGASGALYRSTDEGGHWIQVTPAMGGEPLSDDVISIEFATAQRGRFVTSKQEVWATADGGQTWSKK